MSDGAATRGRRSAAVARAALELALVVAWAAFVGRGYLTFEPYSTPLGTYNEFGTSVLAHNIWTNLRHCGACVLWNGAVNGGSPGFADLLGAPLHPLVIVTTVLWGTIVGGKLLLVASLAMAGLAQLWLAHVLGLGSVARLWSALLVVSSGHLAGRMEQGIVTLVLSTAACSLLLAPLLDVLLYGRRRSAVLLGVALALAIVSGQGYLQLGALLGLGPAALVLLLRRGRRRSVWRELAIALGLGLLLAGVFVVPLAHFWPELAKDDDPLFRSAQPLRYLPLNLVIDDASYFRSEQVAKQPFPYLYVNYIGWIPLALAVAAVSLMPRDRLRLLLFFLVAIAGVFVAASAAPFRALALLAPAIAGAVRNPVLIAGLAVPLIAALAACGVDGVLRLPRPATPAGRSARALGMALALLWSLYAGASFGREWLQVARRDQLMEPVFELLHTDGVAWTATPHGLHVWNPAALEAGLKLTNVVLPWHWAGRSNPKPSRSASYTPAPAYWARVGDLYIVDEPANVYAAVRNGAFTVPCSATARGGNIDVECSADTPGVLEVQEHAWTGWRATRDGAAVALLDGEWLRVDAPEGLHRYTFRYRPWDVALGALLSCTGVVLAAGLWIGAAPRSA